MYKILYKKQNGELIERVRNTLPNVGIGQTTGMGWLIVDILYSYKDKYYTSSEYHTLMSKQRKINHIQRDLISFTKKYKDIAVIAFTIILTKTLF